MSFDALTIALVIGAFLVGGFVKGSIGMGLPVVVLASLALVMPLREAMAVFLIPGLISNIWQATNGPSLVPLVRRLWLFLLASIIAILIGVWIMAGTSSDFMPAVLGVLLIVYSTYSLIGPRLREPGRNEIWMSPIFGGAGGVLFGMCGVFIVPGLLYLETLRMPRDQFIQSLGITFVTITAGLAVAMAGFQLLTLDLALLSAIGLVPVGIGIWLGQRIRHRISEAFYRKLFFQALIVTGIYMVIRTWMSGVI